ncbi:DJ-1/PfpI family protein [Rhizobium multihospitium]|uniref:DJ-1/PfpI family protein n=1 Tax=Rhizobium multihospitium TaxID=410764 RepID=A0A1C3U9Q2_9HYPH|nr:DJ-1/PfpI family protein [Rhizobium multihospitium]SCB12211.1 DJ-1/PfpI family protein [Rhizobium multihospitium]
MDCHPLKTLLLALFAFCIAAFPFERPAIAAENAIRLPPFKAGRTRPLIAIAADNRGTETTDLVIPYGVLRGAGVADVTIVSTQAGIVNLMPALKIKPDATMPDFDREHPEGADIVIVPAMHDDSSRSVIAWIREQSSKGAMVVSICEGAWLAARAGVFDSKRATTHWYAFDKIRRTFPRTEWVHNQRYIVDGNVMSTTGVTASIPASLTLVEAIGGVQKARSVADRIGINDWSSAHDSTPFHMTTSRLWRFAGNTLAFWNHETIRLPTEDGFDEIALALTADAWSRTYRSQAVIAEPAQSIRSRNGLVLVPDLSTHTDTSVVTVPARPSAKALDQTLFEITARYGARTSDIVALQLEYPIQH